MTKENRLSRIKARHILIGSVIDSLENNIDNKQEVFRLLKMAKASYQQLIIDIDYWLSDNNKIDKSNI